MSYNIAIPRTLVRLLTSEYSVPVGSLGLIEKVWPENSRAWSEITHVEVQWATDPGPGGSSFPVKPGDLLDMGTFYIEISEDTEE